MHPRASLTLIALTLTSVVWASPKEEFELRPTDVHVGDAWTMRMNTRVETDPRAQREAVAAGKGEFAETSAEMRCKVLARDEDGRIQLETRYAPQSVVVSTRSTEIIVDAERPANW